MVIYPWAVLELVAIEVVVLMLVPAGRCDSSRFPNIEIPDNFSPTKSNLDLSIALT